jgi:hypothetical protein
VTVEIGTSTYEARARVTEDGERDRLYRMVTAGSPGLSAYEQNTPRQFPIIVLEGCQRLTPLSLVP